MSAAALTQIFVKGTQEAVGPLFMAGAVMGFIYFDDIVRELPPAPRRVLGSEMSGLLPRLFIGAPVGAVTGALFGYMWPIIPVGITIALIKSRT